MKRALASLLLGLTIVVQGCADNTATGPKNGTVLIIRHAEKKEPEDKSDPELTLVGQDRARKYASYFQPFVDEERKLKIDALFAAADSGSSRRPRLTLEPLSKAAGLPLDASIKNKNLETLLAKLRGGDYDHKTVLVCWHHGEIPALLRSLSADADGLLGGKNWPDGVFGWLVILDFGADGTLKSSKVINEKLENDDNVPVPAR